MIVGWGELPSGTVVSLWDYENWRWSKSIGQKEVRRRHASQKGCPHCSHEIPLVGTELAPDPHSLVRIGDRKNPSLSRRYYDQDERFLAEEFLETRDLAPESVRQA